MKQHMKIWGTVDEIRFLDQIKAGHSEVKRRMGRIMTRSEIRELLKRYGKAFGERVIFGDIDPKEIKEWLGRIGLYGVGEKPNDQPVL